MQGRILVKIWRILAVLLVIPVLVTHVDVLMISSHHSYFCACNGFLLKPHEFPSKNFLWFCEYAIYIQSKTEKKKKATLHQ